MIAAQRVTLSRRLWAVAIFVAVLAFVGVAPMVVKAQSLGVFDPTGVSQISSQADGFFSTAQGWAKSLFTGLFVIELTILGVQGVLFRDNIGEFIASFGLKVFAAGFFMWLIVNAQTFLVPIRDGFKHAGQQLAGSGDGTPFALATEGLAAATALYAAAATAHAEDLATSAIPDITGALTAVIGFTGMGSSAASGHSTFSLMMQAVGIMMILACAGIVITTVVITIESAIVMSAGVLFLGFAGTRFTMPFAQGYLTYAVNVGVKLFTLYLVVGLCQNLMPGILTAAAAALAISMSPYGVGSELAVPVAAWAAMQLLIIAALVYAIPNFAGSFLSGNSSLGAGAIMGQFSNAMNSVQTMRYANSLNQSNENHSLRSTSDAQTALRELNGVQSGGPGAHSDAMYGANPTTNTKLSAHSESTENHRRDDTAYVPGPLEGAATPPQRFFGIGTGNAGVGGTSSNFGSVSSAAYMAPLPQQDQPAAGSSNNAAPLTTSSDIRSMPASEFRQSIAVTDWGQLTGDQRAQIEADPEKRQIAAEHYGAVAAREDQQAALAGMMHSGAMRGFIPPPEAPVGGVQIRLNNPDKL